MIGTANGRPISITGLGCYVPDRVLSNDDLAQMVDTSNEWIIAQHRSCHDETSQRRSNAVSNGMAEGKG